MSYFTDAHDRDLHAQFHVTKNRRPSEYPDLNAHDVIIEAKEYIAMFPDDCAIVVSRIRDEENRYRFGLFYTEYENVAWLDKDGWYIANEEYNIERLSESDILSKLT